MFNLTTPTITIDNFIIHQDADGRYCLNDLHAASGGKDKDQPSNWMRAQQTQDLIAELSKSLILSDPQIRGSAEINSLLPVVTIKGGKGKQGTYVVRELVYAYAMWISAAFHLKVIRTFDAVITGSYQAPAPTFERINSADAAAISAIIHRIKANFHYKNMASHAIYSGLRRVYGLEHTIANLPTCYFHDVLDLLVEVERVSRRFQGVILDSEKRFFTRVLRPMLPFDEREWLRQLDQEMAQLEQQHDRTLQLLAQYGNSGDCGKRRN